MKCKRDTCKRVRRGGSLYCWPHLCALRDAGISGRCDATPVREHIAALIDVGWSQTQIAHSAEISTATVHGIVRGAEKVHITSRDAILSVDGEAPVTRARSVPALGASRRINSLRYMGWPLSIIAAKSGLAEGSVRHLSERPHTTCLLSTHQRIEGAFDELCVTRGPSKGAATKAKNAGAVSPMAWDDIDDPEAVPVGMLTKRRFAKLPPPDELQWLLDSGESVGTIAARFNAAESSVLTVLSRSKGRAA